MKIRLLAVAVATLSLAACATQSSLPAYLDADRPIEERVEDALSRMTTKEKVAMCHAQSKFSSRGVPRLGIPDNWMSDGPHGIRAEVLWDEWYGAGWGNDSCTAFPALTALAATWNTDMSLVYGKAIGEEARYRNKNVLLGPGVNIYRTPLNGRNFEYMGEDPCLASRMVVPYVQGVQQNGVAACVKHYALNNQETNRHTVDVVVDDRALYEIYLPAFKAAVDGGAWSIMGSYNLYHGEQCCHNKRLLNDILKGEWGFDGVVVSDWGGTTDTDQAIANGLDMEFGTWTNGLSEGKSNAYDAYYLADGYLERLADGRADQATLDDKVRRILRLVFRTTMAKDRPYGSFVSPEHSAAARAIAQEGVVLLKNDDQTLPVTDKTKRILVVGENGCKPMTIGGGSSSLKAQYEVSPLQGIIDRAAQGQYEVVYAEGYRSPAQKAQDVKDALSPEQEAVNAQMLVDEAVEKAKESDMVVFVGGLNKNKRQDCEGADRKEYGLPYSQDALIDTLSKVNDRVVVVLVSGNAVAMPWIDSVEAVLEGWYLGSEAGHAIADVLFGDVNPSGKLPFTFGVKSDDYSSLAVGTYTDEGRKAYYNEGVLVGYRWFDTKNVEPLFAFGHGLSYTQFEYSEPSVSRNTIKQNGSVEVSINVKNIGQREGKEVVQLYVGDCEASVERPLKELKHFAKVGLKSGEQTTVKFTVTEDDLKFFDAEQHDWRSEKGDFKIYLGSSSRDIRAELDLKLL